MIDKISEVDINKYNEKQQLIDVNIIYFTHCCVLMCRCMQKNNDDTIMMSRHSSLEKYTSHSIERVVCERELETKQRLQHIDPHSSGYHSLSFLFSWATQLGAWGPSSLLRAGSLSSNWNTDFKL